MNGRWILAVGLFIGSLFLVQGNVFAEISFNGITAFKTGSSPFSVAIGDFNGDAKQTLLRLILMTTPYQCFLAKETAPSRLGRPLPLEMERTL